MANKLLPPAWVSFAIMNVTTCKKIHPNPKHNYKVNSVLYTTTYFIEYSIDFEVKIDMRYRSQEFFEIQDITFIRDCLTHFIEM